MIKGEIKNQLTLQSTLEKNQNFSLQNGLVFKTTLYPSLQYNQQNFLKDSTNIAFFSLSGCE